jgi:hypothetical protein
MTVFTHDSLSATWPVEIWYPPTAALSVAPADADSDEVDAESDDEAVDVLVLTMLLRCEVVEEPMEPDAVEVPAASVEVEESEESEDSSEETSDESVEVGRALLDATAATVADVDAALPVIAVSGTALPAVQVASGTPLMMPWLESPRQQVKSLASLLLPLPPMRDPSQQ